MSFRYDAAMRAVVALGFIGCIGCTGLPHRTYVPGPEVTGGDALIAASAQGNATAIAKVLRGPVVYGGLVFRDPGCRTQFVVARTLPAADLPAFARCLATLRLQRSPRRHAVADTIILQYEPGFEIEARFDEDKDGPALRWIGFVSRDGLPDALPTITTAALESLRTAGHPGELDEDSRRVLDAELASYKAFFAVGAWFKLCLGVDGRVTGIHEREVTSPVVERVFAAALEDWQFRPFVVDGNAVPVCALVRLAYPGVEPDAAVPFAMQRTRNLPTVPPRALEARRVSGDRMVVPDDVDKNLFAKLGLHRVIGTFKLCVDEAGNVKDGAMLRSTGLPQYDAKIVRTILSWKYAPFVVDGVPTPACTAVTFIYSQR